MTEGASTSIHDDAILPPNCYECENLRFGIWRSAVAPSDSAEKNGNMDAQLQSITCKTAPKIFRKIFFLYDFWGAQTCSFRAIFGLS